VDLVVILERQVTKSLHKEYR
jgi:hypothetical protein